MPCRLVDGVVDEADDHGHEGVEPRAEALLLGGADRAEQDLGIAEQLLQLVHGAAAAGIEVAEAVGLSRVSARRYLEHLVTTGHADVRLRYGSTGRPERRYRWVG